MRGLSQNPIRLFKVKDQQQSEEMDNKRVADFVLVIQTHFQPDTFQELGNDIVCVDITCLWNSPYYTHSKNMSLNNSKVLCLYVMTSSHQIQVLIKFLLIQRHASLCKFMQVYAGFCIITLA